MASNIVSFPAKRDDDATSQEEWEDHLIDLHDRLVQAMVFKQRIPDRIRMVLSIDDVFELCRMIEQEIGPEHFSED